MDVLERVVRVIMQQMLVISDEISFVHRLNHRSNDSWPFYAGATVIVHSWYDTERREPDKKIVYFCILP